MPQLCEVCLGGNPYIRMEKKAFGAKICNVSALPYQSYRWKPNGGRYKETVISKDVARERNICQCCLNDLKYGLPVGVRDALIRTSTHSSLAAPTSIVGQIYHYSQQQGRTEDYESSLSFADHVNNVGASSQLDRFSSQKHAPMHSTNTTNNSASNSKSVAFRNLPKLCTFWLSGQCKRVANKRCPFRPCCGVFVFPEIAGNKEMTAKLVEDLQLKGPMDLQLGLDKATKEALKEALKGNSAEAIKRRVSGNDALSSSYLNKIKAKVERRLALFSSFSYNISDIRVVLRLRCLQTSPFAPCF